MLHEASLPELLSAWRHIVAEQLMIDREWIVSLPEEQQLDALRESAHEEFEAMSDELLRPYGSRTRDLRRDRPVHDPAASGSVPHLQGKPHRWATPNDAHRTSDVRPECVNPIVPLPAVAAVLRRRLGSGRQTDPGAKAVAAAVAADVGMSGRHVDFPQVARRAWTGVLALARQLI